MQKQWSAVLNNGVRQWVALYYRHSFHQRQPKYLKKKKKNEKKTNIILRPNLHRYNSCTQEDFRGRILTSAILHFQTIWLISTLTKYRNSDSRLSELQQSLSQLGPLCYNKTKRGDEAWSILIVRSILHFWLLVRCAYLQGRYILFYW